MLLNEILVILNFKVKGKKRIVILVVFGGLLGFRGLEDEFVFGCFIWWIKEDGFFCKDFSVRFIADSC